MAEPESLICACCGQDIQPGHIVVFLLNEDRALDPMHLLPEECCCEEEEDGVERQPF